MRNAIVQQIFYILAFSAVGSLWAQKKKPTEIEPNDLIINKLLGKVKSVSFYTQDMDNPKTDLGFAEKIWVFNPQGNFQLIHNLDYRGMIIADEAFEYDMQNRLVSQQEQSVRNAKYPNQNVFNEYNADGLCMATRYEYSDSSLWYRQVNVYNAKKQLVKQWGISPKLDTFERREWTYDPSGTLGEEAHFLKNNLTEKFLYTYDDSARLVEKHHYEYDGSLARREAFGNNAGGKRIWAEIYDSRGRLLQRDTTIYDEQQRITQLLSYEMDDQQGALALRFATTYQYDDVRRTATKTRSDADNKLIDKVVSYFNAEQQVILRESMGADGSLLWHNKYEYEGKNQTIAHRYSTNIVELDKSLVYGSRSKKIEVWYYSRNWSYQPSRVEKYTYNDQADLLQEATYLLKNVNDAATFKQAEQELFEQHTYLRDDNKNVVVGKSSLSVKMPPPFAPNAPRDTLTVNQYYTLHPKTNLITKIVVVDAKADTLEVIDYQYKKTLKTQATRRIYQDGKAAAEAATTTYDKRGNELNISLKSPKGNHIVLKNTYDKKSGLLLQSFRYAEDKSVTEKTMYEYTFDKKGNWTRQIINRNDRVLQITRRIFTYYD
jgi:hypothetical protein